MKKSRLAKILELIEEYDIDTQEAMQTHLFNCGINVTQATVSRDINELMLVKVQTENGKTRYALPKVNTAYSDKFDTIFANAVVGVDYALNMVVIKCGVGMAMAVCASLDSMNLNDIVGTIAGDDTIFAVMRSEASASELNGILQSQLLK